jgi:hypothetical protein
MEVDMASRFLISLVLPELSGGSFSVSTAGARSDQRGSLESAAQRDLARAFHALELAALQSLVDLEQQLKLDWLSDANLPQRTPKCPFRYQPIVNCSAIKPGVRLNGDGG